MTDAMDHPVIGTPEFDDARTDAMAVAHQVKGLVINDMDDYADASAMFFAQNGNVVFALRINHPQLSTRYRIEVAVLTTLCPDRSERTHRQR